MENFETANSLGPRHSGVTAWLWPFVLPLMLLIYWLTSSLVIATLIPSIQAALPALKSGVWIRAYERRLGRNTRGSVLFLFYVADALWLSAAAALLTVFVLVFLGGWLGIQPNMTKFVTAMLTIASGVGATTLIGLFAVVRAWKNFIRVWVHPRTYGWCRGSETQLSRLVFVPNRLNHLVFILGTSLVVPGLVLGTVFLILLTADGGRMTAPMNYLSAAVMIFFFLIQPILSIMVYSRVAGRILAFNPRDCWEVDG